MRIQSEDNAVLSYRFSMARITLYILLLPFRIPHVPCSPQAQGTTPRPRVSHLGFGDVKMRAWEEEHTMQSHTDEPHPDSRPPLNRERYFVILVNGEIKSFQWNETVFDYEVWNFGNCFSIWQEAVEAREMIKNMLLDFRKKYKASWPSARSAYKHIHNQEEGIK